MLILKIRKIIFLLLFPLVAEVVVSCCDCSDYILTQLFYTNKTITVTNLDNGGPEIKETVVPVVTKTAYGLRAVIQTEKLACIKTCPSLFIGSAYAFKCGCGPDYQYSPKDTIISIKVFTEKDFDDSHPAGAEISDYFKVFKPYLFSDINHYLVNQENVFVGYKEIVVTFDLLLMTPPASGVQHQFRIEVGLTDGRVLTETAKEVSLI